MALRTYGGKFMRGCCLEEMHFSRLFFSTVLGKLLFVGWRLICVIEYSVSVLIYILAHLSKLTFWLFFFQE